LDGSLNREDVMICKASCAINSKRLRTVECQSQSGMVWNPHSNVEEDKLSQKHTLKKKDPRKIFSFPQGCN